MRDRPGDGDNGWRQGRDPVQRWLRAVTVVVLIAVFVYWSLGDDPADRLVIMALALGSVLVLLGYEGIVRLPYIGRGKDDDA
jgi:hypothetical protein